MDISVKFQVTTAVFIYQTSHHLMSSTNFTTMKITGIGKTEHNFDFKTM